MTDANLLQRIDRIESHLAIQQLPIRYAIAVDSRDVDAWINLFVEDVRVGRDRYGRDALREFISSALTNFYRSHHQICGQQIDFIDDDHATGKTYCRAEHEDGDSWVVMAICYFDTYERRNGTWYFARRQEEHWYSSDVLARPEGPSFQNWPSGTFADQRATLPHRFDTWARFWNAVDDVTMSRLTNFR